MAGFNHYYYLENKHRGKSEANELALKDFLQLFFKRCHIEYNPYEKEIKTQWKKISGKLIEKYTKDLYINKDILYVRLSSQVAKHELSMVKGAMKNKINREIGKEVLKDIVLL